MSTWKTVRAALDQLPALVGDLKRGTLSKRLALFVARAAAREGELAMRLALGAGPRRPSSLISGTTARPGAAGRRRR
jgi:hypothetical protein